jgi:hypothetical protein
VICAIYRYHTLRWVLKRSPSDSVPSAAPCATTAHQTKSIRMDRVDCVRASAADPPPTSGSSDEPPGGPTSSDRDHTLETHIAPFGIAAALLLPQEPYGVTTWSDPEAAAGFCVGTNDYSFTTGSPTTSGSRWS